MGDLVKVTIEGSAYSVEKGTLLSHFLVSQMWTKKPILAVVNGQVSGLYTTLEKDSDIRFLYDGSA